jgi:hydroxymethylpyrimidine kinase/phosphomethylpyrimidine kinase
MSGERELAPVVLTIAGFDPSGGAGIMADIRAIQAFACVPVAAITSITFQNSENFLGAVHQTGESVREQVQALLAEHEIAAAKVGMLPTSEVVRAVAWLIRESKLPAPVLDPVLRSSSGAPLIEADAIEVLKQELFPLACVITPNIPEAEKLTGLSINDESEMRAAAARLRELGAPAVLVKGGHLAERSEGAVDILDDDGDVSIYRGDWVDGGNVRGSGCMLASAIAAGLAQKKSLDESVHQAKDFVADAIRQARISGQPAWLTR